MSDSLKALAAADAEVTRVLEGLHERHGSTRVECSQPEWDEMTAVLRARDAAREALMPTEMDAIRMMREAYTRLKDLGWNDPIYCPKDGSPFDVIEAGSTGIHSCAYVGEWPTGSWWIDGEWPSRPVLYRVTAAELEKREQMRDAFRAMRNIPTSTGEGDGR